MWLDLVSFRLSLTIISHLFDIFQSNENSLWSLISLSHSLIKLFVIWQSVCVYFSLCLQAQIIIMMSVVCAHILYALKTVQNVANPLFNLTLPKAISHFLHLFNRISTKNQNRNNVKFDNLHNGMPFVLVREFITIIIIIFYIIENDLIT